MANPDKKVRISQRKNRNVYQHQGNPKPFENEGSEFGGPGEEDQGNDTRENADFDRMKGIKRTVDSRQSSGDSGGDSEGRGNGEEEA